MKINLTIVHPDGTQATHSLSPGIYELGRELGDIILRDPSASARHAKLEVRTDGLTLWDLGSSNGTLVGGVPALAATAWQSGQRAQLAHCELTWQPDALARGRTLSMNSPLYRQGTALFRPHREGQDNPVQAAMEAGAVASGPTHQMTRPRHRGRISGLPGAGPGRVAIGGEHHAFAWPGAWLCAASPVLNADVDVEFDSNHCIRAVFDPQFDAPTQASVATPSAPPPTAASSRVAQLGERALELSADALSRMWPSRKVFLGSCLCLALLTMAGIGHTVWNLVGNARMDAELETAAQDYLRRSKVACWSALSPEAVVFPAVIELGSGLTDPRQDPIMRGLVAGGMVSLEAIGKPAEVQISRLLKIQVTQDGIADGAWHRKRGFCIGTPRIQALEASRSAQVRDSQAVLELSWAFADSPGWLKKKDFAHVAGVEHPQSLRLTMLKKTQGWQVVDEKVLSTP